MAKKIIAAVCLIFSLSLTAVPALAESIIDTDNPKYADGSYNVDDFVILAIRISRLILGIVGSLTLLMFVYGGFLFLISAGSSDKIKEGKSIIKAAIIGLAIVFSSFLIISFVLKTMGISWDGKMAINTASSQQT